MSKKLLELHKKRIVFFGENETNCNDIESLKKHAFSLAVVSFGSPYLNPSGYWNERIEKACERIIFLASQLRETETNPLKKYYYHDTEVFYKNCVRQKTLTPSYVSAVSDEMEQDLEMLKISIETILFENNDLKDNIDLLIEHINIDNRLKTYKTKKEMKDTKKTKLSYQESHKLHDKQISDLNEIVCYLEKKHEYIKKEIAKLKKDTENISAVDLKIELFKLEQNIRAKKYYIKKFEERRAVLK